MKHSEETIQFVLAHRYDDVRQLALQADKYPEVDDMPWAVTQIAGRQMAMRKIPLWGETDGVLYPKHLSMEQCSSEVTARYKASLVAGETLVDLTGGLGVDSFFMGQRFKKMVYVECQAELCELASHNLPLLGMKEVETIHADAERYLHAMNPVDCIFLDPARRDCKGSKTVAISDCVPNVKSLASLLLQKADKVWVKLSPMLDLAQAMADLPMIQEVHVVSVENECKELLTLLGKEMVSVCPVYTVNLTKDVEQRYRFSYKEECHAVCQYTSDVETYLYEPNASVLKAGAYKSLAEAYGMKKLHPNSHLYTSKQWVADFPGRAFLCDAVISFQKKELKAQLGGLSKANLTVRNFPATVAELRKRTKLAEGGDVYLFATTLYDGRKVLLRCTKVVNHRLGF